jgi:ClpP class serine protease
MPHWLIDEGALQTLRDARRMRLRPSETQLVAFEREQVAARDGNLPRGMSVAGATAEIRVVGILTKQPDIFALFFGGGNTTYRDLIAALGVARSDPSIKNISLYVDSPGGDVDGLFELLAALEQTRAVKAISVRAANAMSAAYGISAVAGRIEATNAGSRFGSVGVAAAYFVDDDIVDITNTDSPDKRPDVTTDEGRATVRRELDAIHDLFIEQIARGRGNGVTARTVREEFGRGATMLAGDAKRRGMIDAIARVGLRAVSSTAASETSPEANGASAPSLATEQEQRTMNLRELRAQHPETYEAAVQEGVTAERDRVNAHLELGQAGGAEGMRIAAEAIAAGTALNQTMNARYLRLAMNNRDQSLRASDEQTVAGAANAPGSGAAPGTPQSAQGQQQPAQQQQSNGTPATAGQPQTEAEKQELLGVEVARRIKSLAGTGTRAPSTDN